MYDDDHWKFERGAWRRPDGVWFVQWADRSQWRAFRPSERKHQQPEAFDFACANVFEGMQVVDRHWPR